MTDSEKLERLLRHVENVRENCELLGRKLIEQGKTQMGLALIANGRIHDNSKFYGIEWDFLDPGSTNRQGLKNAITHHHRTNPHHPEYWGGIDKMPDLYVAEMICDWKARSTEFARCLIDWINGEGTKRYKIVKDSPVHQLIMVFVDMICEKPFVPLEEQPEPQQMT